MIRVYLHLWHPKSPLSSTPLVKAVFFSNSMTLSATKAFETRTSNYESYVWPFQMIRSSFINVRKVLTSLSTKGFKVLVLAGGVDKLMSGDIMRKMVVQYRDSAESLVGEGVLKQAEDRFSADEKELKDRADSVIFSTVEGAGHHFQNDVMWEVGARRLASWHGQL